MLDDSCVCMFDNFWPIRFILRKHQVFVICEDLTIIYDENRTLRMKKTQIHGGYYHSENLDSDSRFSRFPYISSTTKERAIRALANVRTMDLTDLIEWLEVQFGYLSEHHEHFRKLCPKSVRVEVTEGIEITDCGLLILDEMYPFLGKLMDNGYLRCITQTYSTIRYPVNAYVHELVAEKFVPNPHNLKYICHLDGNFANNKRSNLIWTNEEEYYNSITRIFKHKPKLSIDSDESDNSDSDSDDDYHS